MYTSSMAPGIPFWKYCDSTRIRVSLRMDKAIRGSLHSLIVISFQPTGALMAGIGLAASISNCPIRIILLREMHEKMLIMLSPLLSWAEELSVYNVQHRQTIFKRNREKSGSFERPCIGQWQIFQQQ